jgi:uncharacterized membrane protein
MSGPGSDPADDTTSARVVEDCVVEDCVVEDCVVEGPGDAPAVPHVGGESGGTQRSGGPGSAVRSARSTPAAWAGGRVPRGWLAAVCLGVFALYATYAWVRHLRFVTTGFDLGIFDQAVRAYSRFEAPIVPLKAPGYNLLGDHFHPVIALWAPLYWIWDDPRMLLLAQAALVAASVVPVVSFCARRFGGRRALLLGLAYGLSWPLQRMIQFDVHEIAFAVPLIAVVIDALDRRAYRLLVPACAVLLLVREDMGAFVLVVGVLVGLRRPTGRRSLLLGLGIAALGVAGYRFAIAVVIPYFAGGAGFVYWTFPALGPDLPSALRYTLGHPWSVLRLMVVPWVKARTLLLLGLPTLYLGLGSRYLLLGLPFVAQRMLNSRTLLWTTNFHYSSVLAPILVMAAADTLRRVLDRTLLHRPEPAMTPARRVGDAWVVWCLGAVAVGMAVQAGDYPVSRIWTPAFWVPSARAEAISQVLPLIPPDVCIEAENTIAPHLTRTDYVTRIGRSNDLATWMVLDLSRRDTGWEGFAPAAALRLAQGRGFTVVVQRDVIVLLHRPSPVAPLCLTH